MIRKGHFYNTKVYNKRLDVPFEANRGCSNISKYSLEFNPGLVGTLHIDSDSEQMKANQMGKLKIELIYKANYGNCL